MTNLDYKEGRGDYYLAQGKREERSEEITVERLASALRNADASMRDYRGRNRSRTSYYWRDLSQLLFVLIPVLGTVQHQHDPDVCDECQEMVMEALRD